MTNALQATEVWVVKVLDPRTPRESAALGSRTVLIGHDFENDIVVRNAAARGRRVALDLSQQPAELLVLDGDVGFLGQTLAAPCAILLPAYVPVALGDVHIAYGKPDHPRWEEAWRLADAARRSRQAPDQAAAQATTILHARRPLQRLARHLPLGLAVLAVTFVGVAANANLRVGPRAPAARPLRPAVRPPSLNAQAVQAEALFTSLGVSARAMAVGQGLKLQVASDADPMLVDQARRLLMHEAPTLKTVEIAFVPADVAGMDHSSDGAKRIAAAVAGPDGYLLAVDGTRYFPGAQLPTGQILKSIDNGNIEFEQNGIITDINYDNKGK